MEDSNKLFNKKMENNNNKTPDSTSTTCENETNNQNNILFNETTIRKTQRIGKKHKWWCQFACGWWGGDFGTPFNKTIEIKSYQ